MTDVVIGEHADRIDTGVWRCIGVERIAPENISIDQLKDYLLLFGGSIYLREDGRFGWLNVRRGPIRCEDR